MFAIITVALISGAIADRARFGPWMLFAGIWATIVYFPVAHWVFAFDDTTGPGRRRLDRQQPRAIDFAGGTAVHINAGAAGLALALVLGKRVGWKRDPMRPHNLPLVMIGAGLLWFGWFGFNAGSALGANTLASVAWINTHGRDRRGRPRLAAAGEDPRRSRDVAGRRVRCGRRPGRHHAVLLRRSAPWVRWSSASSPASCARWRSA